MNGTEQKAHTRKTDALASVIADTQAAVIERFEEVEARMQQFRERLSEERTHRLKLAQEQRGYVDNEDRLLRQCCQERWNESSAATKRIGDRHQAFVGRTFWERLRWLVTGR